jgi:hypothetical protein
MTEAGNAARTFVSTVMVAFSGMALNASETLAFGVATLKRDTAIPKLLAATMKATPEIRAMVRLLI